MEGYRTSVRYTHIRTGVSYPVLPSIAAYHVSTLDHLGIKEQETSREHNLFHVYRVLI